MIKGPISLLAECAEIDMSIDTEGAVTESVIRSKYRNIEEASAVSHFSAEMVPVQQIGDDYLVEAYSIMPFMKSNDITNFADALDYVNEANHLPPKTVGLLIESEDSVEDMIDCAISSAKESGKPGAKKSALKKVDKVEKLADGLKSKGYKVKKKAKDNSKKNIDKMKDNLNNNLDKMKKKK